MKLLGEWIIDALRRHGDDERLNAMRQDIERFCLRFPVPGVPAAS
jgi:glycine/serine hydroxymethyltransferase